MQQNVYYTKPKTNQNYECLNGQNTLKLKPIYQQVDLATINRG
jgi:hypothetical protein